MTSGVRQPLVARFEAKVDRSPGRGPWSDCHTWTAAVNQDGYGKIILDAPSRAIKRAHHVAWYLATGEWPALQVNHLCDNPACVRVDHLYLGTQRSNVEDMLQRQRSPVIGKAGEANHSAKLTRETVETLRAAYAAGGVTVRQLAREAGVDESRLSKILRGLAWA